MANNDIVIVGPPMATALYKAPSTVAEDDRRLLLNVDVIGAHDDFLVITCRQPKIALLRAAGAEVIVLEPDANRYAQRVEEGRDGELLAFINERIDTSREDLRIADLGRERDSKTS